MGDVLLGELECGYFDSTGFGDACVDAFVGFGEEGCAFDLAGDGGVCCAAEDGIKCGGGVLVGLLNGVGFVVFCHGKVGADVCVDGTYFAGEVGELVEGLDGVLE